MVVKIVEDIINSGAVGNAESSELKKIKLFNIFCLMWGSVTLFFILKYLCNLPLNPIFYLHLSFFCLVFTAFICHKKHQYTLAYIIFIIGLFLNSIVFGQFMFKNKLMEFYMVLPYLASLILVDNKWINRIVFVTSYLGFILPNIFLNDSVIDFKEPHLSIFFFIITGTVYYFKTLNQKNEKALLESKKELEDLNRFQAQFFTNISHEIRTPLTLISGYTEQIENLPKSYSVNTLNIKKQTQVIKAIVDDVLDLSKMETGHLKLHAKHHSLNALLKRLYETHQISFENKGVNLVFSPLEQDVSVFIDVFFIERALSNLLNNALKFTDVSKTVIMTVSVVNNDAIIQIIDQGIGIAANDQPLIFNRFYQANNCINKSGGSGVGLAFTKEIIELSGGHISVESKLDFGSTFTVKFPCVAIADSIIETSSKQDKVNNAFYTEMTSRTLTKTILVVEDHLEMQKFICDTLLDFNCCVANNGVEALEKIKSQHFDLVITDYMMPKMDGYTLIKNLKEKHLLLPVIMLTARTEQQTKVNVLQYGVNDYITKPFDINELRVRVNNTLKNQENRMRFIEEKCIVPSKKESEQILKIKAFVQNNLSVDFKTEDITEGLHISKSTLQRVIKSETGLTVNQLIKEIKLTNARTLIENNVVKSIKEVAYSVGFSNASYFSNQYYERFGCKPFKD